MISGFFKKRTNKKFEYEPRFYKPEDDDSVKRKRKISLGIQRERQLQKSSNVKYMVIFIIIAYIFLKLQGLI